MVLAAGLGTRLGKITRDRPKALVEIAGRTLLEITLDRLRQLGVTDVIINVHHFAENVAEHLRTHDDFGMRIELSPEKTLLDTGGGLRNAAWFFEGDTDPFILHNVDVLSTIDLARMVDAHQESGALATLAVQDRPTSRPLLFDGDGRLCGRERDGTREIVRECLSPTLLGFGGIHVISPRLLPLLGERQIFSIIDTYVGLAGAEWIAAFRTDEYEWRDVGRPEDLAQAQGEADRGQARNS